MEDHRKENSMAMHSVEEDITPARAAADLETARCGRKPSMTVIGNYARDMKARNWPVTPEGIVYDADKVLRDGQQRFYAVLQAATELFEEGKISSPDEFSVRMMVTYDMPDEVFRYLNSGKSRTLTDLLGMDGHSNEVLLHALLRRIAMWQAGKPMGNVYRPTNAEKLAILVQHPEAVDAAAFAARWSVKPKVPTEAVAGFLWWLLGQKSEDDRDVFMEYLRTGSGLTDEVPGEPHPLIVLRNRIHGDFYDAKQRGTQLKAETVLWLCLNAWDAWRTRGS
jgi:hypothetical protein